MTDTKRKVGGVIIMHPNHNNYGTALQGLASIKIIQELGYNLRIIRYRKKRSLLEMITTFPGYIRSGALDMIRSQRLTNKKRKENPAYAKIVEERTKVCNAFKDKYFEPLCDYYTGWDALCKGSKNYDVVFVGSDQVWSPLSLYAGFYNLLFVDKCVPQFSYSSSFGVSNILDHQKKGVASFLKKMDAISVREIRGAEIVKELTERDAKVVSDPTLLLNKRQWEEAIKDSNVEVKEKYILCYMLGPRTDNREAVTRLGRELGLKIITFNHMDRYVAADEGFGDEIISNSNCLDFVKLLANAEYVVTDSFHCSVFSLIFHKQFLTFYRINPSDKKSTHSRIDSLLGVTGTSERAVKDVNAELTKIIRSDIDWIMADNRLQKLREDSMEFLKMALEIRKKMPSDSQ